MRRLTWAAFLVIAVLLIAIAIMFHRTDDAEFQMTLLGLVDRIIPFVLGAGTGYAAGTGLAISSGKGGTADFRELASNWTGPLTGAVVVMIIVIAFMVGDAVTVDVRDKLVGYIGDVAPFVVGGAPGVVLGALIVSRR